MRTCTCQLLLGHVVHASGMQHRAGCTQAASLSSAGCAQGRKNHCVAVIGDGAITGGMAYEAMNHAGFLDKNMIVVLNDNQQVCAMETLALGSGACM